MTDAEYYENQNRQHQEFVAAYYAAKVKNPEAFVKCPGCGCKTLCTVKGVDGCVDCTNEAMGMDADFYDENAVAETAAELCGARFAQKVARQNGYRY